MKRMLIALAACVGLGLLAWQAPHAQTCIASSAPSKSNQPVRLADILDTNGDQVIDPFEALDQLLQLEDELGKGGITSRSIKKLARQRREEWREEARELLQEMDANGDNQVELTELEGELGEFADHLDSNGDNIISLDEMMQFNFDEMIVSDKEEIEEEVAELFGEFDHNADGHLTRDESSEDLPWDEIRKADQNDDNRVSRQELIDAFGGEELAAFEIIGGKAVMTGVINGSTPAAVLRLAYEHPRVRTIVMQDVPGSMDDEANVRAARYVRRFGFTTILPADGVIASGGTDFFVAGATRIIHKGAKLGIHSWGGPEGETGRDVPRDHPAHQLYLDYYEEMGIPAAFYWRTLEAAPADDICWMTEEELARYNFRTETKQDSFQLESSEDSNEGQRNDDSNNREQQQELTEDPVAKGGLADQLVMQSCTVDRTNTQTSSSDNASSIKRTRIAKVTDEFPRRYQNAFDRYVQVIAPNGKPINIFAQEEISDAQIRHVREVMVHYLTDFPGSKYGTNKGAIANRMAENGATMMICKGHDGQYREPRINAQPLYADETIVEGTDAYINNQFEEHRDASLEEILHCVHDNGIGVDVSGAPKGVLPEFQKELRLATTHALNAGIWPTESAAEDTSDWIEELRQEGSLTQEYLASVIDSYYGLWGPFDEDFGMWGVYIAKTREDIKRKDPRGYAITETFFHPCLTYDAEIVSSFQGTFSMTFEQELPYTHKSQYLLDAHLTGDNDSNLTGNDQDNTLAGNAGDNVIDGREGTDTVVFSKPRSAYQITKHDDGSITVVGEGTDKLIGIEELVFDGDRLEASKFVDPVPFKGHNSDRYGPEESDQGEEEEDVEALFKQLDRNNDGKLQRSEVPDSNHDDFEEADANEDGVVTLRELKAAIDEDDEGDEDDEFSRSSQSVKAPSQSLEEHSPSVRDFRILGVGSEAQPLVDRDVAKAFPKQTRVFGILVAGSATAPDGKILHAARVLAEYLDSNEDGMPDNQAVVDYLVKSRATLVMAADNDELKTLAEKLFDDASSPTDLERFQDLQADETHPGGAARGVFDGALEEVLHLITHVGYANVYPEVFGESPGSEIADAMDVARGGRFLKVPAQYPQTSWYSYDDETCGYECMVTEYVYWAMTSILGGQQFEGRREDITDEWRLNTRRLVEKKDVRAFKILTNPKYGLPTRLPDGEYSPIKFSLVHANK